MTSKRWPKRGGGAPANTFYETFVKRRMDAVERSARSESQSQPSEPQQSPSAGGGDGSKGVTYDEYKLHRNSTAAPAAAIAASLTEQ